MRQQTVLSRLERPNDLPIENRVQALIEEELGELRLFAELSSEEIEAVAARLTRTISTQIGQSCPNCFDPV